MRHIRKWTLLALTPLLIGGAATPLAADPVSACLDYVLTTCADAMENSNWLQRFALGVLCTGLLTSCSVHE
jgi:hypothetical protein